jgi:hypothetical protein
MTAHLRVMAAVFVVACGGTVAERPLTIPLGIDRSAADAQLQSHKYCHKVDGPRPAVETYPRCDRAGMEWGESWVEATYDAQQKLVGLRRYERINDDARATERWNKLIAERAKLGAELEKSTDDASVALRRQLTEPGTRTMKAFRIDNDTVVGVYLLTPQPPHDAQILEAVIRIPKS